MLLETLSCRMPESTLEVLVDCAVQAGRMGVDHRKLEAEDDSEDDFSEEDGL